jgi:predicted DNA-binding protein
MLRAVAEQLSCFVKELAMKTTLANAEAALDEVQRDTRRLHSRELREVIEKYIEEQRDQIKALRRMMN